MSGFVPMQASWWETIRATLPKPWPREAAAMDLRWHADRATPREHWRPIRFPGRPALAAEWGWSDWDARTLMRDEAAWKDTLVNPASSGSPPASLQSSSSAPPATTTENADKSEDSSSTPPAGLQETSTRDLLLTLHPSPSPSDPPLPPEGAKADHPTERPTTTPPAEPTVIRPRDPTTGLPTNGNLSTVGTHAYQPPRVDFTAPPPSVVFQGVELPGDLPALLGGLQLRDSMVSALVRAGVCRTKDLVSLDESELRFLGGGFNAARRNTLKEYLFTAYGVKLGKVEVATDWHAIDDEAMSKHFTDDMGGYAGWEAWLYAGAPRNPDGSPRPALRMVAGGAR